MEVWAGCAIPLDVIYDLDADVWVSVKDDVARIGMTDVAQTRMGRLVQLSWKERGKQVRRGRPLCALESAKWVGPMISPLSGVVLATNAEAFLADVAIVNRDPYGAGWFYEIQIQERSELDLLVGGERAVDHYHRIIEDNKIHCYRCED